MNQVIFQLTLHQLFGKRRTIILALFACVPVLIAAAVRLSDPEGYLPERFATHALLNGLVITTLLPLAALVFSTAALGSEIEDSTIVYILSKPIARWRILTAKLAASWIATALLVGTSTAAAALIVLIGHDEQRIVIGFTIAVVLGSLAYSALFVLLSLMTSRALIVGLIYVFFWEGAVTALFDGTKVLSVRQYTIGIADLLVSTPERIFSANLDGKAALVLMAVGTVLALYLAVRRLERLEIGEST